MRAFRRYEAGNVMEKRGHNVNVRQGAVAAGIAALLFLHCAYLNTLYNAKGAFDVARKAHGRETRQHPDSAFAPSGAILAGYDRAIDKTSKVLDAHPKKKK